MTCIDIGGTIGNYDQWDRVLLANTQTSHDDPKFIPITRPLYCTCERVRYIDGRITTDVGDDAYTKAMTVKQMAWDHLKEGEKVSYIQCDIGGDEEHILEDLLHFAYVRRCVMHVKIYPERWKDKDLLTKVADLLNLFGRVPNNENILMLHPKQPGLLTYKPNPTVCIISYNWYTFTKQMVDQLERFTRDIVIFDNNSSYPPLLKYHKDEYKYTLFNFDKNHGHQCWFKVKKIREILGDVFIITDPDLLLNPSTPRDFIKTLYDVYFKVNNINMRVGLALDIFSDDIIPTVTNSDFKQNIVGWESRFWRNKVSWPERPELEMYKAELDTTFCIVHQDAKGGQAIRVAGDFTAKHLPWHEGWKDLLLSDEYEWYKKGNVSSTWA